MSTAPADTPSATETDPLLPQTTTTNPNDDPQNSEQSARMSRPSNNIHYTLACLYGGSAVALGAFGAHGLKRHISDPARLANWATAAQYQLIHAVALLAASLARPTPGAGESRAMTAAKNLFVAGMTMFSGSLYGLVLLGGKEGWGWARGVLGPVTPLGGLCLIAGWVALAWR